MVNLLDLTASSVIASLSLIFCCLPNSGSAALGSLSQRAKCAIECYTLCTKSGTPKAVYCNCPLSMETEGKCNLVSENLLTEKTVERQIESESGYNNARTIWLRVEPVPSAFIYIFEFSIQSTEWPIWTFAGASSAPQITISVPDSCRDYQFRVLVVLRSSDVQPQLVAFRPKPIPARFPPFVVPKESVAIFGVHMDRPRQSGDEQTLHVLVSWQHPPGYDDSDIYGYSPPTAYPIRCQAPEDRLSQPRLELVSGGARLHLNLPVDVLQERCRIYMEVQMLPRCVRIEPFDIQISIELDCQKFPHLRYCRKEQSPQCTDVVDLWGKDDGRAIVVWERPAQQRKETADPAPSFYILNWGPAQSQGSPPFVTRRIVQNEEIRVPGNVTKAELWPKPGVQYGLQICAFYAERENADVQRQQINPFQILPVIPFTCTPCRNGAAGHHKSAGGAGCIDCSKIEEIAGAGGVNLAQSAPAVDCLGPMCASANRSSVHFISSDTVMLDVFGAKVSVPSREVTGNSTNEAKTGVASWDGGEKEEGEEARHGWTAHNRQWHSKTHLANSPISLSPSETISTTSSNGDGGIGQRTMVVAVATSTFSSSFMASTSSSVKTTQQQTAMDQWSSEQRQTTTGVEHGIGGGGAVGPGGGGRDGANAVNGGEWRQNSNKNAENGDWTTTGTAGMTEMGGEVATGGRVEKEWKDNGRRGKTEEEEEGGSATNGSGMAGLLTTTMEKTTTATTRAQIWGTEKEEGVAGLGQQRIEESNSSRALPALADSNQQNRVHLSSVGTPSWATTATATTPWPNTKSTEFTSPPIPSPPLLSAVGIRRVIDSPKLVLAGPLFFLFGLLAGLILFCSTFRRRYRHPNGVSTYSRTSTSPLSPLPIVGPQVGKKLLARSVLAARTDGAPSAVPPLMGRDLGRFASNAPIAANLPASPGHHSSASSSCPSSVATVESRCGGSSTLGGTSGSRSSKSVASAAVPIQQQPACLFVDNTARFFMGGHATGNGLAAATKSFRF